MKNLIFSACLCVCGTGVASAGTFSYFGAYADFEVNTPVLPESNDLVADLPLIGDEPIFYSDGGLEEVSAYADLKTAEILIPDATVFSQSNLLAADGTPELKAFAASSFGPPELGGSASASASGLQTFAYDGPGGTLNVTANFHGVFSLNELNFPASSAEIQGMAGIWLSDAFGLLEFDLEPQSFNSLIGEPLPMSGWGTQTISSKSTGPGEQNFAIELSIDLEEGDEFVLYGALLARSFGMIADASNTGTFSFSGSAAANISVLGNTVAPVPVPAAVWLMGSALVGLVGFRRKKQSA